MTWCDIRQFVLFLLSVRRVSPEKGIVTEYSDSHASGQLVMLIFVRKLKKDLLSGEVSPDSIFSHCILTAKLWII